MSQLVYTMFISDNCTSFHLLWKANLVKHQKVSKYCVTDCRLGLNVWQCFEYVFVSITALYSDLMLCTTSGTLGILAYSSLCVIRYIPAYSKTLRCRSFPKKNIEKKHLCHHDQNYCYFCKSNIPLINLIVDSRNMIKLSKNMSL